MNRNQGDSNNADEKRKVSEGSFGGASGFMNPPDNLRLLPNADRREENNENFQHGQSNRDSDFISFTKPNGFMTEAPLFGVEAHLTPFQHTGSTSRTDLRSEFWATTNS